MRCYPREGIVRNTQDGVYLVNRIRGNQRASGVAYYANFGNNNGQEPDDYVEVSNDDYAWWENGGQGMYLLIFHPRVALPSQFCEEIANIHYDQ
jgi:hypothetical protein